jgi:hypothetical protein
VLAFAAPAHAAPGVGVEHRCYAEGDSIGIRGYGFTAGSPIRLTLERRASAPLVDTSDPVADPNGIVTGSYQLETDTGWFEGDESRFTLTLRMAESAEMAAATTFTLSRWNVDVDGTFAPGRAVTLNALGFTQAVGKTLYAHYVRGGKRVKTIKLGTAKGPCGNRKVHLSDAFPFDDVAPGEWRIRVNAARTDPTARDTIVIPVRVRA